MPTAMNFSMRAAGRSLFAGVVCALLCRAADIPTERLQSTTAIESNHPVYYWKSTPVAHTAQLLTLYCYSCQRTLNDGEDQPLVAILRDTLGDSNAENDRVTYVWLLTYSHLNLAQRALSAVPFFYWRVSAGSGSVSSHDLAPLFDLTAPQHPVVFEGGRDLMQWMMLDPMTTPIRASSRAYRTNQLDNERLHLEEAISYLRQAPASSDDSALTQIQLDTVIARLQLRKTLLGGLVNEKQAARIGAESGFEQERIRSRNWELLRQCAERTGLVFEPLDIASTTGKYAILWFPVNRSAAPPGGSLGPVWKLLNLRDPWSDDRLKNWKGSVYTRTIDNNEQQVVPLGVYSLDYPKLPLLLIDFRDKLHVRWHEMTQRSINEITAGVIGISHFTNWYYYVAADLYDFVVARHGAAMNQAARLDSYSQFRVALALDRQLDPALRREMQRRVDSLAVNPMESSPMRELEAAKAREARLVAEAGDGGQLAQRVEKERREELSYFSESKAARVTYDAFHDFSLGFYTHRVKADSTNLAALDVYRRIDYQLRLLDSLIETKTQPEVAYDSWRIQFAVAELSDLIADVPSPSLRAHTAATLSQLKSLSQDEQVQANCSAALLALNRSNSVIPSATLPGLAAAPVSLDLANSLK